VARRKALCLSNIRAFVRPSAAASLLHNKGVRLMDPLKIDAPPAVSLDRRLRKHADYQRVYREGRKQFSPSMSYFYAMRPTDAIVPSGPRVGLTAGKVLGNAVERNRIKRRMRDIVRRRAAIVVANVDIVLHPRKSVLIMDFAKLESEVARIFTNIQAMLSKNGPDKSPVVPQSSGSQGMQ
jgi:ribonuclease P protein component